MEKKIETKKSYFLGIVGATMAGLIILLPLAFIYVYIDFPFILAVPIFTAIFEFYGYKWFKGKINEKLPTILLIVTIINILIMSLLFIPIALMVRSNITINIETIKNLYYNSKISLNIIQDLLIATIFGVLGVYIVSLIIKRKLLLNIENINLFSSDNKERQEFKEKAIKALKPNFEKYGATQKDKIFTKEELLSNSKNNDLKEYFNYLEQLNIIKKYNGKYYYDETNENNIKIYYPLSTIIGVSCVVISLITIILSFFGMMQNRTTKKVYNSDVSFKIETGWTLFEDYSEEYGWSFYKYLDIQTNNEYPTTIGVTYDKNKTKNYNSIEDLRKTLEIYFKEKLEDVEYKISTFTTQKGYEALKLIQKNEDVVEYDYYIYKDGKMAYITAISYNSKEDVLDELEKYAEEVVNSFEWNK